MRKIHLINSLSRNKILQTTYDCWTSTSLLNRVLCSPTEDQVSKWLLLVSVWWLRFLFYPLTRYSRSCLPTVLVSNHQTFPEATASVAANALPLNYFKVCTQVEFIYHLTHISFRKQFLHSNVSMLCLYSWAAKYTFLLLNLTYKVCKWKAPFCSLNLQTFPRC